MAFLSRHITLLLAFLLAHFVRYTLQWLRPVNEFNVAPFDPFIPYVALFAAA